MKAFPDLLATGTLTWETAVLVERLPEDGRVDLAGIDAVLASARRIVEGGGGSAANVACAAARAGLRVVFAGRAGDDAAGRHCAQALEEAGVEPRLELVPGRRTKRSVLLVEASTGRVQFRVDVPPLAAPPLPSEAIPDDLLARSRWLHLDRASAAAPDLLHRRGEAPASLDLHDLPMRPGARVRLRAILPRLSLLQVREVALPGLLALLHNAPDGLEGPPPPESPDLTDRFVADALGLLSARVPRVVVTRGDRGAMAAESGGSPFVVTPVPADPLVDPSGAGDAFAATLVVDLLAGRPFPEACFRAAAAGSRACSDLGARPR